MGDGAGAGGYLSVGYEVADHVDHFAQGGEVASADVDRVAEGVAEDGADENLRGVFDVNHGGGLGRVGWDVDGLADGGVGHEEPADEAGHAGEASVAEHGADADAAEVEAVHVDVLGGGEVVDGLGHTVDVDRICGVVLVDGVLAEGVLDAVDGDGRGVDDALDSCPAGDLEDVVGALDVDVEAVAGAVFAGGGQKGGEVDDAGDVMGVDGLHQVGHVGDVAAVEGDGIHAGIEGGARRGEVEGDDILPAL